MSITLQEIGMQDDLLPLLLVNHEAQTSKFRLFHGFRLSSYLVNGPCIPKSFYKLRKSYLFSKKDDRKNPF